MCTYIAVYGLRFRKSILREAFKDKSSGFALLHACWLNEMLLSSLYVSFLFVCVHAQSNVLTFAMITSFGQFGMNSSGVVPAIDMALRDINNSSGLLPGYTLAYDRVRDSQVSRPLWINWFRSNNLLRWCIGILQCRRPFAAHKQNHEHVYTTINFGVLSV